MGYLRKKKKKETDGIFHSVSPSVLFCFILFVSGHAIVYTSLAWWKNFNYLNHKISKRKTVVSGEFNGKCTRSPFLIIIKHTASCIRYIIIKYRIFYFDKIIKCQFQMLSAFSISFNNPVDGPSRKLFMRGAIIIFRKIKKHSISLHKLNYILFEEFS